jgi:mono/diheme cytochrome c family protein
VNNALKIFGFTVLVIAFYTYVGQMVPQQRAYPPEQTELSAEMSTEEMVEIGEEIARGKGTCMQCHTIGEEGALRFPDLANIGARAGDRREGYSDVEYLAESLYEPNAFVVEGFAPGMPAVDQPPIALTDQEIMAVIAYLQSLGGTPSVTMDTELEYQTAATGGAGETADTGSPAPPPADTAAAASGELDGSSLFTEYQCQMCHTIDTSTPGVGPSLHDVGSRLNRSEIYEAIVEPDAEVTEGYQPGLMTKTLEASGFFSQVSTAELRALVDYLASQTGE